MEGKFALVIASTGVLTLGLTRLCLDVYLLTHILKPETSSWIEV